MRNNSTENLMLTASLKYVLTSNRYSIVKDFDEFSLDEKANDGP